MRVTRIPGDHNDIGDKPCRVYLNEAEITDWTVADNFRRVVETPAGARFGAVRIEWCGGVVQPDALPAPVNMPPGVMVAEAADVVEIKPAKPNVHIPARKRKASK